MKYDSIILDIDGTIWDTTDNVAQAWNDAVRPYNKDLAYITGSHLKKEFGKIMDVIAQDLWPELDKEVRTKLLAECCILEHNAVEANTRDITYSGVVETVRELSKVIDFYVVSNCQKGYIEQTLSKTGLAPFIKDSRFSLRLPLLEIEETQYFKECGKVKRKKAVLREKRPICFCGEVVLKTPKDYKALFLPENLLALLPSPFTATQYAKAMHLHGKGVYGVLHLLSDLAILSPVEGQKRPQKWCYTNTRAK